MTSLQCDDDSSEWDDFLDQFISSCQGPVRIQHLDLDNKDKKEAKGSNKIGSFMASCVLLERKILVLTFYIPNQNTSSHPINSSPTPTPVIDECRATGAIEERGERGMRGEGEGGGGGEACDVDSTSTHTYSTYSRYEVEVSSGAVREHVSQVSQSRQQLSPVYIVICMHFIRCPPYLQFHL
jgi:hypothetical protein